MLKAWSRFVVAAVAVGFLVAMTAESGLANWRVLLDEHFDKDQRVPALRWPWNTPIQNPNIRWHYNPWAPYYRYEPVRTDYTWGLQDYIFNNRVRQHEEFPGSIWCAYTNQNNVDNPRWPEDDNYMDNQNAWVWWGPFDLRRAKTAAINFWVYVDVQYGSVDSLSVVVSDNVRLMTLNGVAFDTSLAFGCYRDPARDTTNLTIFNHRMQTWERREFYLDSLRMLTTRGLIRDTISYCERDTSNEDSTWTVDGGRSCWVAFVWQSNQRTITGRGAFVDDVMVVMDDGLFELAPIGLDFGYPIDEENIDWSSNQPRLNDSLYFRLKWTALGIGDVGPFNINCILDSTVIYSEERTVTAGLDTVYETRTPQLWSTSSGHHVLRWEIDTPTASGGAIEESDENNNYLQTAWDVEWNPAPLFSIYTPNRDSVIAVLNQTQQIFYTIDDSNETDGPFTIYMYWTYDTTGLAANPYALDDPTVYHYVRHSFAAPRGDSSMVWDLPAQWVTMENREIEADRFVYIVGLASDGFLNNRTIAVAPGRFYTQAPNGIGPVIGNPVAFDLSRPFPNPFNRSVMIDYSLPTSETVHLSVFDLSGRLISTLVNGVIPAGYHRVNWSPSNVGAGVYLVKLETGGRTFLQKAIYTP